MGTNITGIGNANAIGFKSRVTGGMYFPPELKDALVGVWSAYGKSNDSTDRNVIKNKIKDRGGDFELLNFNYKEGSGYGKYEVDFDSLDRTDQSELTTDYKSIKISKIKQESDGNVVYSWGQTLPAINSTRIRVKGLNEVGARLVFIYLNDSDQNVRKTYYSDGTYDLPSSPAHAGAYTTNFRFAIFGYKGDCNITIEQIPQFQGAVVTDGVDDLIMSVKTMQEMLEGSTEFTAVSMIHLISPGQDVDGNAYTNYIRTSDNYWVANRVSNVDKTGIYGYSFKQGTPTVINNILGDKNDYTTEKSDIVSGSSVSDLFRAKFSVEGFEHYINGAVHVSSVAWYWTFIAKRVLTEDEINLVIEKYNLDRPGEIVKPDIYYDIKRQKITNENHSSFDDELTDFSGNGHNMKLYNLAWKGGSGIAAKKFETLNDWVISGESTITFVKHNEFSYTISTLRDNYWRVRINNSNYNTKKITIVVSKKCYWFGDLHYRLEGDTSDRIKTVTTLLQPNVPTEVSVNSYSDFEEIEGATLGACSSYVRALENNIEITVTIIPSYKGGLLLDGVDDYGKVTNVPIYKDYTIVAKYQRLTQQYVSGIGGTCPISKSHAANQGAFIMDAGTSNFAKTQCYSFGKLSSVLTIDNSNPEFHYQTKYIFDSQAIVSGDEVDSDSLWLGTFRDRDSRFFNGVIYSLMSFPYSLSEFLIERQINKARAGTLYPSQVEFRPIIPEDENITKIDYFVVNSGTWTVIKPGDYVDVGARIVLNVYTKLPYKVEKVSSPAFTGMSVRHSTELNIFDVEGYIKDKTPQKIKLTLAVNEDIVQWNPAITSNLLDSFTASSWYLNGWDNTLTAGTWIKKTDRVFFKATFKTELYGLETATFGGTECVVSKADNWSDSKNIWDIRMLGTVGDLNQVFDLNVYELIRFEDIVQPYPSFVRLENLDRTHTYTWGDKLKVGDTIRYNSSKNLLEGAYTLRGQLECNGVYVFDNNQQIVVTKEIVFAWSHSPTWAIDNNEPKCVLSPRLLSIPNSSYKILGYIPDISGHGNHGKINNSAYAGMSGANGYVEDFTTWGIYGGMYGGVILTDSTIKTTSSFRPQDSWVAYKGANKTLNSFSVNIEGIPEGAELSFRINMDTFIKLSNGRNDLFFDNILITVSSGFRITKGNDLDWSNLVIEQIGEYEGTYCLDGVDDFVTIPTLSSGGKQVLMKVNWSKNTFNEILYDQRENLDIHTFAIYNYDSDTVIGESVVAYNSKNNGNTYIDGILNYNIKASELKDIEHNITITNELVNTNNSISPIIGTNKNRDAHYAQMSLYDFMLFDEISTDDKIKELNEYIGVEENVFAINPNISIDTPEAVKDIKIYQGGEEISSGYLYLNKDTEFEIYVSLNTGKYSLDTITVDGVEITKDRVVGEYNIFKFTLNGSSEQNITIHSYEYIMYEDIVQPFPTVFRLLDTTNNYEYTYRDKLKVGSEVKFTSFTNLLPELYRPNGTGQYNGVTCISGTVITVEKQMVFSWSASFTYLKTNAPKCIFSPSKLRMPNESYRYLGYIPDISGNGNNGVFNNFAFGGMSGADGYPFNFQTITVLVKKVSFTDDTLVINRTSTSDQTWALNLGKQSEPFDLYVNWEGDSTRLLVWAKSGTIVSRYTLNKEWNNIPAVTDDYDYIYLSYVDSGVLGETTIKQKAKYEGSICFDGVDDSILTSIAGGRTVFLKTSVISTNPRILYDQRDVNEQGNLHKQFAIYTSNESEILAYVGRNPLGETYIDGILNKNITCADLIGIKHNITATAPEPVGTEKGVRLGASNLNASYCKAAIYDFAIFDNVLPSDEIRQFNDIMGIEGDYVQKPDYYWDSYGKNNFDIDKDIIQQRGTAKGYNFASFDDELDWYLTPDNGYIDVVSRNGYEITLKNLSTAVYGWYFQNSRVVGFITRDIPFKVKANKSIRVYWDMHSYKISSGENFGHVVSITTLNPNEDTSISLRHLTENELTELDADKSRMYYLLWFDLSTLAVNEEVTIEMLPVEGGKSLALTNNNFAYDKMSGYGGYSFKSFNDSQDTWNIRGDGTGVEIISRDGYSMTVKKLVQNLDWQISNNEYRYPTVLNKELPFKCKSNKNVGLVWQLKYKTEGATSDTTVTLINRQLTPNVPLEISLPYTTQEELTELGAVLTSVYYLLYFSNTTLEIGEEYTVEMLPLYPDGLVFDGIDDYSENADIPVFSDYTYIIKFEDFDGPNQGSCIQRKGGIKAGGGAFVQDHIYNGVKYQYNFGIGSNIHKDDSVAFCTRSNYNGTSIASGNNTDDTGFTVGKFDGYRKMVFYKEMLYPRTIDMLSINMVKNMMEEDGIIDLTSKLFTDKYTGDFYEMDFNNDFFNR
jgi:hypothetical protein